jgi:hypothetical protein
VTITLQDIPELLLPNNALWQVKALVVDGRSPAIDALESWQRQHPDDYKRILKSIRIAVMQRRITADRKHVGKNQNPKYGDVYEFIAYTGIARLMFFYDDGADALIVCTNAFEKSRGSQDAAFARCAAYRDLYLKHP